ncbi:glycosyltransferase family 4 protein [Patescibacteria group bacterium]|nr:glycosyltransferase family 4 protein [Patescibacteria group bacterium]
MSFKKRTVCFVVPYTFAKPGGVGQHVLALGKGLKEMGLGVYYVSPTSKKEACPEGHIRIGRAVRLPNLNGSWSNVSLSDLSKEDLVALVKKFKIDIFHFQELLAPAIPWQIFNHSPIKNVVTAHAGWDEGTGFDKLPPLLDDFVSQVRQRIDLSIAVSPVAARCASFYLPKPVHIVPNAVNLAPYRQKLPSLTQIDRTKINLLFVGRLDSRKGATYLVRALAELGPLKSKIVLHIAGSGPQKAYLKLLSQYLEIEEQVVFWGRVSEKTKIALLQQADIFISPAYRGESFGIVLVEAMAAGRPLIAGLNDGYKELLKDYPWLGGVVDVKQTDRLVESIRKLVGSPKLQKKLSNWGQKFVEQFDAKNIAKKHLELYEEVMSR